MDGFQTILKDNYNLLPTQPISHAHLKVPIAGIALTQTATKLPINTTNFQIDALGGFTFDNVNNRFIWDADNIFDIALLTTFIGDAGLQVTSGTTGTITLEFRVDNVIVLETNIDYDTLNKIQSYGANDVLIDDTTKAALLNQNSSWEVWARTGSGETPTITLEYLNVTVKGR